MAIISDGRGGYIETTTGQKVDANGTPVTPAGARTTTPTPTSQTTADAIPGLPGYNRQTLAAMLGIPANDPRMDQYMNGQTPQGAWSIQQIAQEVAKQSPDQRAAQLNSGGYISPWQQAQVVQAARTRDASGNWNADQFQNANQTMNNQIPASDQDRATMLWATGQNQMWGDQTDPNSIYSKLSSGLSSQAIQGAGGGNALGNFQDPMAYQIFGDLGRGLNVQQIADRVNQAHAMYPGMPAADMATIQKYANMYQQYGSPKSTTQPFGGAGQPPVTSDPSQPGTNADGSGAPTAISNQIRNNWMNSPVHNPGGINTYAIQNMKLDDLGKGMAGGPADTSTYEQSGQNYNPTAAGTGSNAFGGGLAGFSTPTSTGSSNNQVNGGLIDTNFNSGSPTNSTNDITNTAGYAGGASTLPPPPTPTQVNPSSSPYSVRATAPTQDQPAPDMTNQQNNQTYTPGVNTTRASYFGGAI